MTARAVREDLWPFRHLIASIRAGPRLVKPREVSQATDPLRAGVPPMKRHSQARVRQRPRLSAKLTWMKRWAVPDSSCKPKPPIPRCSYRMHDCPRKRRDWWAESGERFGYDASVEAAGSQFVPQLLFIFCTALGSSSITTAYRRAWYSTREFLTE
jgi:hypothetical protein